MDDQTSVSDFLLPIKSMAPTKCTPNDPRPGDSYVVVDFSTQSPSVLAIQEKNDWSTPKAKAQPLISTKLILLQVSRDVSEWMLLRVISFAHILFFSVFRNESGSFTEETSRAHQSNMLAPPVAPSTSHPGGAKQSESFRCRSPPVSPVIGYANSKRPENVRTPPVSPVIGNRKDLPPIHSPRSTMSPRSVITASMDSRRRAQSWNSERKSLEDNSPKSIERKLATIKKPTAKHYNVLGNAYFRQGNLESATMCYKIATTMTGNMTEKAAAFLNLGTVYWKSGQIDAAVHFLELAKADSNIADSVEHQLGVCYALSGDFDRAIMCLETAKGIRSAKFGPSSPKVAQTIDEIGKVYLMKGEDYYEVAMKCHQQALLLLKASGHCTASTLLNMAKIHRLTHHYKTALSILQQVSLLKTNKVVQVQTLQLMADVYECMGNSQKAMEFRELGRRRSQSN